MTAPRVRRVSPGSVTTDSATVSTRVSRPSRLKVTTVAAEMTARERSLAVSVQRVASTKADDIARAAPRAIECPKAPSTRMNPPRGWSLPHSSKDAPMAGRKRKTFVPDANSRMAMTAAAVATAAMMRVTNAVGRRARTSRPQT
jgi:hypothetical protein